MHWVGGLIAFVLFFVICYFIGQLGVQIKSGLNILKYVNKAKTQGQLNEKGKAMAQKGRRKIFLPTIGIVIFYLCVFLFIAKFEYQVATIIILIPVVLGYFGIFLIPEQFED